MIALGLLSQHVHKAELLLETYVPDVFKIIAISLF